jgi:DNA replication and repair protein RecF
MLTDIRLQNFRSYIDDSFEFSPGVNIIVGPNASGKTNLLEAILVLANGSSYRARDSELVRFGQPWARLDSNLVVGGRRSVKLINNPKTDKTYEIDGKTYKRLTRNHSLPNVLFEPNHLRLFTGSPERRRDYLDDLLEQTTTGYGTTRRQYKRVLVQRNNLLKQGSKASDTQMFPWDIRLSRLAGLIVRERSKLTALMTADINGLYKQLSQAKTKVTITYDNSWPVDMYESRLLKKLETSLADDIRRGFTGNGPHREDLIVAFNGHATREIASRGEVRTAALALKIIELKIIEAAHEGQRPLLLLDDVFSELDGKRRHALTDYLAPYQTFITTTDADIVLKYFAEHCNVIPLS